MTVTVVFTPAPTLLMQLTTPSGAPLTLELVTPPTLAMSLNEFQPGSVTEDGAQVLSNKELVDPKLSGAILDAAGLALLEADGQAGAVNYIQVFNAATGYGPGLAVAGGDANADFNIVTAGSGVLKVNGVAVAMLGSVATLAGVETLTNKRLDSPKIGTAILDTAGAVLLGINAIASAVNYASVFNAAAGGNVGVQVFGADSNINYNVITKGSGTLKVNGLDVQMAATAATLAGTQTLANKTLTSPRISTGLLDTSGNEVILTPATASAVNEWTARNAATGGAVKLDATGGDPNINAEVNPKGAGQFLSGGKAVALAGKQMMWLPARSWTRRPTNGPATGSFETSTNKVAVETLDFDAATAEFAQFPLYLPPSYDSGTITYVAVWRHAATATNFGVCWKLSGVAIANAAAFDVARGTAVAVTDTGGTTDYQYTTAESGAITIAGTPAPGKLVVLEISRDPTHASDTMAIDASLVGVVIFFNTNAANEG